MAKSSRAQIATYFINGDEFFAKHGTLLNAVHAYFVILGRDPSASDLAGLQALLRGGTSFSAIVDMFVSSPEHNQTLQ